MCCGPFDYDYPTFGGKHPRADRRYGRVGSPLSDPAGTFPGPSADSNLTPVEPAPDLNLNGDSEDGLESGLDREFDLPDDRGDPSGIGEELESIVPESLREDVMLPDSGQTAGKTSTARSLWRPSPLR